MEQWKTILDYPRYEVSNYGQIRNAKTKRLIKFQTNKDGYNEIKSKSNGIYYNKRVHRVVALHFINNPNNYPFVNHLDANKTNNRADNLEWCTNQMNIDHAVNMGLIPRRPVINIETKEIIPSLLALSRRLGWSKSKIKHMLAGRCKNYSGWEYLTPAPYLEK